MDFRYLLFVHPITWEWPFFRIWNEAMQREYPGVDAAGNLETVRLFFFSTVGFLVSKAFIPLELPPQAGICLICLVYVFASVLGGLFICQEDPNQFDFMEVETDRGVFIFNWMDFLVNWGQSMFLGCLVWCLLVTIL